MSHPANSSTIQLVTGADDRYALPMAVTIRSMLDRLGPDRRVRLFVLDGGIGDRHRELLLKSWRDQRLEIEWLRPDVSRLLDLPVSDHVTTAAYIRLLMPQVLPADVDRLIYLDSDLLVRRDLGELWDQPQGDHPAWAAQELAAPLMDSRLALPNYERCRKHLAAERPVANYRELGMRADSRYMNTGLLVVDLARWRRENLAEKVLACLNLHRQHVLWWDQYALNVVLADRWGVLDRRWNQVAHAYQYPSWRESPLDRAEFECLRSDPWIVHFCSPTKPWHYFCPHPYRGEFYATLDRTAWTGWRPDRPTDFANAWWDYHRKSLDKRVRDNFRTFKLALRERWGRAA